MYIKQVLAYFMPKQLYLIKTINNKLNNLKIKLKQINNFTLRAKTHQNKQKIIYHLTALKLLQYRKKLSQELICQIASNRS